MTPATVGLVSSILTGIILAAISYILMRPLLSLLGSKETILPYACDYFRFILMGTPFIMGTFTLNNQMRHQGNAMLSMIGIVSGAALNIALDPILIFGFGLGIRGAGMATALPLASSSLPAADPLATALTPAGSRDKLIAHIREFFPEAVLKVLERLF